MSFLGFGKKDIPDRFKPQGKDRSVTLTPVGKDKAEKLMLDEPLFGVLAEVHEHGTLSVRELSDKTGHSIPKVEEICKRLESMRCIKFLKV